MVVAIKTRAILTLPHATWTVWLWCVHLIALETVLSLHGR